jgi:hypothetical protein
MMPGINDRLGIDEPHGFLVIDVVARNPAERLESRQVMMMQ